MPLLRINATPDGLTLHDSSQSALRRIGRVARGTGPVIIMIHRFKYQPSHPVHCPHGTLFSLTSENSWPAAFLSGTRRADEPLCIAFGWSSRGGFRAMHSHADKVAIALGRLIRTLKTRAPSRPVHVLSHSLGAQVALSALPYMQGHDVRRMILLTGACHVDHAHAMLETAAGRTLDLINVISRENDLIDLVFERLIPGQGAVGRGITAENSVNLQLDCAASRSVLTDFGFPIAATDNRVCHWSAYTRDGTLAFYANAMLDPDRLSLCRLKRVLPKVQTPHFSRLWSPVRDAGPLVELPSVSLARKLKKRIMAPFRERGSDHEPAY